MSEVRLNMSDVRRHGLPPVCAACGAPAAEYRRRWFHWTPGRNIPFALLGTWRYTRVTLDVPFCGPDRTYFTRRWVPFVVVGLLTLAAATAIYVSTDVTLGKAQPRALWSILLPTVAGIFAVLYVVSQVVRRRSIRIFDVDGNDFTLGGVSDGFAAAVESGPSPPPPVVLAATEDEPPEVSAVDSDD
jgi:hypothetical protein